MLSFLITNILSSSFSSPCNCTTPKQKWNIGTGSIGGFTIVDDINACAARCCAESLCKVYTFSATTRKCWMKTNDEAGHVEVDRDSSICRTPPPAPAPTPPPPPPPPPPPSTVQVGVNVDTTGAAVAYAGSGFVSYTLDWWEPTEGCRPEGWGPNANVLELNFESEKLIALTKALGPAYLRIGGSLDKFVKYDVPGAEGVCNSSSSDVDEEYHSSCLNATRWNQLHAFTTAVDAKLVFGLSYPRSSDGTWNSSQAEALFRYSKAQGYDATTSMYGFELGEELTSFKLGSKDFEQYTQGYRSCAALLTKVFGAKGSTASPRPMLMGPCPGMSWPQLATWFPAFLNGTAGALDIAVYHSYNQIVPEPAGKRVLFCNTTVPSGNLSTQRSSSPGGTGWQGAAMAKFAKKSGDSADVPLWLGEFGPHNGGGGGVYASSWVSSFGYFSTLGTLAALNHSVLARQTLVGGNYELLRCSSGRAGGGAPEDGKGCDFEPHPDYYIALLWKRLMGRAVLRTAASTSHPHLELHAHCTAGTTNGSITLGYANMDQSISFELAVHSFKQGTSLGVSQNEFHLTAANAAQGMDARVLSLNGGPPLVVGTGTALPNLSPRDAHAGPVVAAPYSIGFVIYPDARAAACMKE
tara:strand:+ start:124 stop:2034 length:1911 start_codon:yes stop_codon:yes gene_type:complete